MNFVKYVYLLLASLLVLQAVVIADNDDAGHEPEQGEIPDEDQDLEIPDSDEIDDPEKQKEIERLSSMEGHMKPLGSVGPYFKMFSIEGFPSSPREFFNKYVIPSTPVVMRNAAKISPAFTKWTDSYFINHPGSEIEEIFAEGRKKEVRTEPGSSMTFKNFVEKYNTTDMYMVHGLPHHIRADVIIPPPLQCDPVLKNMMDVVTWFSSGGTKSVLHNDDVDNLNCLYRGNKTLVFLNPHDHDNIWQNLIDVPQGSYSSMDVDAVDYTKFPDLATVRYSRVDMQAGDCLFIPYSWYHQVNSFGSNLAVNLWWSHKPQDFFDLTDEICGDFTGRNTIANITYPGMDGENENVGVSDATPVEGQKAKEEGEKAKEEFFKKYRTNATTDGAESDDAEKDKDATEEDSAPPKTETVTGQGISYSDDYEAKHLDPENQDTADDNEEGPQAPEGDTGSGPYISPDETSITDKIFFAIQRIKKPVKMGGLQKYVLRKFPETLQTWNDRCQEILINYFGMLDQNKDTVLTIEDTELFYELDDHARSQFYDATAFFLEDLRHALYISGLNKERELVQKLLDRGDLDKEQIATIFGNKLVMPSAQHSKDEL